MTTPLALAAFDAALRRFGTRRLTDLIGPAIQFCEQGFLVRPHVRQFWTTPAQ